MADYQSYDYDYFTSTPQTHAYSAPRPPPPAQSYSHYSGPYLPLTNEMRWMEGLLKKTMSKDTERVFHSPVDYVSLSLKDYLNIVPHPMDLGTVEKKLRGGAYATPEDVAADIELTFENSIRYNGMSGPSSYFGTLAKTLQDEFRQDFLRAPHRKPQAPPHHPYHPYPPPQSDALSMDELKRVVEEVGQLQSDPQMINRIIEIITRFHNMPEDNELDIMALPAPCLREIQRFLDSIFRQNRHPAHPPVAKPQIKIPKRAPIKPAPAPPVHAAIPHPHPPPVPAAPMTPPTPASQDPMHILLNEMIHTNTKSIIELRQTIAELNTQVNAMEEMTFKSSRDLSDDDSE